MDYKSLEHKKPHHSCPWLVCPSEKYSHHFPMSFSLFHEALLVTVFLQCVLKPHHSELKVFYAKVYSVNSYCVEQIPELFPQTVISKTA